MERVAVYKIAHISTASLVVSLKNCTPILERTVYFKKTSTH